jgi:serine/threonine-protein kinase PRP4
MITRALPAVPQSAATLSDNYDTADGYYRIVLGEVLDDGRYHVFSNLGKGMFSAVVKARVVKPDPRTGEVVGQEVAIKIIRSQDSMCVGSSLVRRTQGVQPAHTDAHPAFPGPHAVHAYRYKAGLKEIQILNNLRENDPDDKKHIVKLERTFEHRGHLCMVFESLSSVPPSAPAVLGVDRQQLIALGPTPRAG